MHAVVRVWNHAEEMLVAFLLAGMTLVTFAYVVFNNLYGVFYSLGDSLPFANETMLGIGDKILYIAQEMTWSVALTKAMFGWLIFVGLAWGVRIGAHIGVDLLVRQFNPANQRRVAMLAVLICLGYCALMAYSSEQWVATLYGVGTSAEDLDRFGIAQWQIVMIVPIGFALMFVRFLQIFIRIAQGKQQGLGLHSEVDDAVKLAENDQSGAEK
ncbi:TRAP transporter small permease [Pseudomonas psychrophila]|uniref:TRAP transporter small permease protein n=1 Tax=Pseudomonas psychrophila TaxID=122355 RepID=A0ABY0VVR6_9PSED|nr:TRAP transporter small permease [Pseudomonas psychrophila]KAB0492095.1 TRAP transporter small permease [Pseudomonas psychrophila]KMM99282.1 C4-dicarboxylate ABC transporter [Pseudomonas psychrophila]QIE33258.1 TRAP transporter small permease [Pseudomonas psychrophila]WVI99822.1 TRAP transporter small permease [Pseudomonas psychrophila]SDU58855.1 C4-dicarboxylate transporter, DctQ subunit [Pseudomonas psychrophila]